MLGITIDDLPAIQRAEFLHYLAVAEQEATESPGACSVDVLVEAVCAAFGLDPDEGELGVAPDVVNVVVDVRRTAAGWDEFGPALWARRHELREDLA